MARRRSWSGLVAGVLALAARPAQACVVVGLMPATIDPSLRSVDHTPPTLPMPSVAVTRGHGPQSDGCGGSTSSSCDDLGELVFTVGGADDMTPAAELGYSFALESGTLPEGFTLPPTAVQPQSPHTITLSWVDGAIDGQEPIGFTLRVVAVDRAGNESVARLVEISDGTAGGCRVGARGQPRGAASFLVAAAALLARRRRRPRWESDPSGGVPL